MEGKVFKEKVLSNIGKVIIGKEEVVTLLLTSLLADGHVLLEDVPGTGKTKVSKSLAKSLDASFNRIQFTPDLLPSDLTGINFYNQKTGEFEFRPVGYGCQDWKKIIDASEKAGANWVVVEQDDPSMNKTPIECAELSINYLKTI